MNKRIWIYAGIALLTCLLVVLYLSLREEKPEYFTPEIPMPQYLPMYAGEYAAREEFSTYVDNAGGQRHHYFIYRMYVPVYLGEDGFGTQDDVENYYDKWMKKLGWQETGTELCEYEKEMGESLQRE